MILPKKTDIDKQKNDERKRFIDEGIVLAKKVDKLRETSANEEKQLKDWRESSLKLVQADIAKFIEEKETLKHEIEEATREREALLKPLTKEWEKANEFKAFLSQEKTDLYLEKESLKLRLEEIEKEREKVSKIVVTINKRKDETEKAKSEATELKDLAQREYEMAHSEHDAQTEAHDKAMSQADGLRKEYEVALSLIKIRENEVKEKEVDIIKREQHLASQQVALRIAYEEIKKNASQSNNT